MVDKKRDNPSHGNLEQGCQSSPTPAAGFFLDGGQCGGTGNVEDVYKRQGCNPVDYSQWGVIS